MANHLAAENSPYLLQHAENPVDWYPWGPEALELARSQDKPIFLSIGYSACHWCHVMAHESFENEAIARLLNEHFISIKVDREERPDLDQIYMEAVQRMSGHGGWPLSAFLSPNLEPFFGGTYWPAAARGGLPGFADVLRAVAEAWNRRRTELTQQGRQMAQLLREDALGATVALSNHAGQASSATELDDQPLLIAEAALLRSFDRRFGGFGAAPKFPPASSLRLLLRRWGRTHSEELLHPVRVTLDRMAQGGMYDQLGGGFHRYSVDAQWLVPHFEKMLYDNALLADCYLEGWQVTGDPEYARVVRETLDYVLRDMRDGEGGFHSAEDADSEGEEGVFYVWSAAEIREILGADRAAAFGYSYGVSERGNFEGRNVLNRPQTLADAARTLDRKAEDLASELEQDRRRLLAARDRRVRPGRDDKVLVSWNGLMIEALAHAGAVLGVPSYLDAAADAANFLLTRLRAADGRLQHYWRGGRAAGSGYLDDYAGLANALVTLYEARFEERWLDAAAALADEILRRFADPDQGGFFFAEANGDLLARKKDFFDSPMPSGSGLATMVLLRLGRLAGRKDYLSAAERSLTAARGTMERAPTGAGTLLLALDMYLGPAPEIVILGGDDRDGTSVVLAALARRFLPNKVVAYRDPATPSAHTAGLLSGIFAGKAPLPPGPTVYICRDFACQAPVSGKDAALRILDSALPSPERGRGAGGAAG
jgi:hypothetical protein